MPVTCPNLRTEFIVPSFLHAAKFRRFLREIDTQFAEENVSGDAVAEDAAAGTGFKQVAVIRDPDFNLFLAHKHLASERSFKRRKELDVLKDNNLSSTSTFEEFLDNFDRYTACSEMLGNATIPHPKGFERDAPDYDHCLDFSSWENVEDYFRTRFSLELTKPQFLRDFDVPRFMLASTKAKLNARSKPSYAMLQPHLLNKGSVLGDATEDKVATLASIPTISAPKSSTVRHDVSVACMLKESEATVRKFIEYYQGIGVGNIKLFFDDPTDPCLSVAQEYDRVTAVACDDEFWDGSRKRAVEGRQSQCYTRAYHEQTEGWLIICDADEFAVAPQGLGALLDSCDPTQRVVRFRASEAIWDVDADSSEPFSAQFVRALVPRDAWAVMKHKKSPATQPMFRHGMLSHRSGKYAIRVDSNARFVGLHRAEFEDGYNSVRIAPHLPFGTLVHFDAICFDLWWKKMENRMRKGHGFFGFDAARKNQISELKDYTIDEAKVIFKEMYHIDQEEFQILAQAGSLQKLDIFN